MKQRKLFFFSFTLLILSSCNDAMDGVAKPQDLIPKDTMVLVLKDLSVLESHVQNKYIHVSQFHEMMKLSGNKILKKYHLEYNRFNSSMDYFGSHQDQMKEIYAEILDLLNHEASALNKKSGIHDSLPNSIQNDRMGVFPMNRKP